MSDDLFSGDRPFHLRTRSAKSVFGKMVIPIGPPGGYVLTFSNGLVVYLSGDTGITAEQELVVNRFYKANMAVINIGDTFTTGPVEAAYVMNAMVKPKSVIASHANEEATKGGKVIAGTR